MKTTSYERVLSDSLQRGGPTAAISPLSEAPGPARQATAARQNAPAEKLTKKPKLAKIQNGWRIKKRHREEEKVYVVGFLRYVEKQVYVDPF